MKKLSLTELANRAGMDPDSIRQTLEIQWTTRLLAAAAGVSDAWIRRQLIEGKIEGSRPGHEWFIAPEAGNTWLHERGIEIEK
jgi:hypothetical protein